MKVETKIDHIVEKVNHLDSCVDRLKATIWQATGAITVVMFMLQLLFRK